MSEAIAGRVAELRQERGLTQEELADRIRRRGFLDWSRSRVAALETARHPVRAEDLLPLCVGLGVALPELCPPDGVVLAGGAPVWATSVRRLFSGEAPLALRRLGPVPEGDMPPEAVRLTRELDLAVRLLGDDPPLGAVAAAGRGRLEEYLGRRLGVHPYLVAAASFSMWGRSATEERGRRAGQNPDMKSVASRHIRQELEVLLRHEGAIEASSSAPRGKPLVDGD